MSAASSSAAQDALSDLRRLSQAADDPRVALPASRVATYRGDAKDAAAQAELALRQARACDAPGMIAEAQLALAQARFHLGETEIARAELAAAITDYRSVGNPHGEAGARRALASVLSDLNRVQDARKEYQRAMGIAQGIGDLATVAAIYRDLCGML
jgi:tetratricopeptide (TPR) repeat protein